MSDAIWEIHPYQRYDKSITLRGPLLLEVDYDDVNTDAVDLLIVHFLKVLNEHWTALHAWHCENEDCPRGWDGYSLEPGLCKGCGLEMQLVELES